MRTTSTPGQAAMDRDAGAPVSAAQAGRRHSRGGLADRLPSTRVREPPLYRMAKSRWEIENQGFNDGKNPVRHGAHPGTITRTVCWSTWLLTVFALDDWNGSTGRATYIGAAADPRRRSSFSACSGSVCVRPGRSIRLSCTH